MPAPGAVRRPTIYLSAREGWTAHTSVRGEAFALAQASPALAVDGIVAVLAGEELVCIGVTGEHCGSDSSIGVDGI